MSVSWFLRWRDKRIKYSLCAIMALYLLDKVFQFLKSMNRPKLDSSHFNHFILYNVCRSIYAPPPFVSQRIEHVVEFAPQSSDRPHLSELVIVSFSC